MGIVREVEPKVKSRQTPLGSSREGPAQAKAALRQAIVEDPGNAQARLALSGLLVREGALAEAETCLREALAVHPRHAPLLHNLGMVFGLRGRPVEAAQALRAALAEDPDAVDTWMELAGLESRTHGALAAVAVLHEALVHCPEQPALLHTLALSLLALGRASEAMSHLWHALRVAPDGPGALDVRLDLAGALKARLRLGPAQALLREALARAPGDARVLLSLGALLYETRRYHEAAGLLDRAIELAPGEASVRVNRAMVHMALGQSQAALAGFRQALALRPGHAVAHSNLLLAMQYSDAVTGAECLEEARRYGARFPRVEVRHENDPDPDRPLRVGYVSGDFRRHVVGLFLLPVLRCHDPAQVQVHAYSMVGSPDPMTEQMRGHARQWVDARAMNDAALAQRIRADRIDVLVDLSGHSADNRLPAFALRPAPVQLSWLGYPGHIGLPAIGHRITDGVLDPPGEEAPGVEHPLRLPNGWFCYAPLPEWGGALPVSPLPAQGAGQVTFGAFNNLAKVSSACLDLWAEVLEAVPRSRLLARAKPFDDQAEQARFKAAFAERGIAPERIGALPYLPDPLAHMKVYEEVDVHLDSLPYAGGTTSCDALWMGVPVVTLRGDRPSARLGASVLSQLGLSQCIAHTPRAYVAIARALAEDLDRLAALRAGLRERFVRSPLHQAEGFTRGLEAAYRQLWREWVLSRG